MRYVVTVSFDHAMELRSSDIANMIDASKHDELFPYDVVIHEMLRYDPSKNRVHNCSLNIILGEKEIELHGC